jgi:hypothetical protein
LIATGRLLRIKALRSEGFPDTDVTSEQKEQEADARDDKRRHHNSSGALGGIRALGARAVEDA